MKRNIISINVALCLSMIAINSEAAVTEKLAQQADLSTSSKTFKNFKVEIQASTNAVSEKLLSVIPSNLEGNSLLQKVSEAVDKERVKSFPDVPVFLSVTRLDKNSVKPATISGYVSLYKANTWWNKYLSYGSAVYGYNYYVNTVACFANVSSGSVYSQYQAGSSWYSGGYISSAGYMTYTGYDGYKGCKWTGSSSYNVGNFIELVYD